MMKAVLACLILFLSVISFGQTPKQFDVVVYGATPAGIAASVNAAQLGVKVALIEESNHIGGLTSGGLSFTDFRTFEAVQGTFREFMNRVLAYYTSTYGPESQQVKDCYRGAYYEPKVAKLIFEQMLSEQPNIEVFTNYRLERTEKKGNRLTGVSFASTAGKAPIMTKATVFIDATYEGDLIAKAGCAYRLGRESKEEFGERYAGKVFMEDGKFLAGSTGGGDKEIQNYNFRICMTKDLANAIPVPKPTNYVRDSYLPLLEEIKSGKIRQFNLNLVTIRSIPNNKADVNDRHFASLSLALWGESHTWPEGSPEHRKMLYERHKDHALGLIYFVQNDREIPASIQAEARNWGLPKDEYTYNENFTPALYVREGRRLVGSYIFKEQDTQQASNSLRAPLQANSIAVGDYGLNSHGTGKRTAFHPTIRDGQFSAAFSNVPHQIPYGVIVPKMIDGLLAPVPISATHVGYSALRMEPIWTALGQAAGVAAALAIKQKVQLRNVKVHEIQEILHEKGAITIYFSDVLPGSPFFKAAQYFGQKGFLVKVPAIDTVHFEDHLKFIQGQFTAAFPHHYVYPHQKMNQKLMNHWLEIISYKATDSEKEIFLTMTRGDFLNELYRKFKTHK
ncbi:FAD-dependent oxidoreductase [Runella sp. CRIBMP]|uniref:FAD-dependent oxidoreductase n=1 Tax=Runella sp. CRIBMP TaxID=2683261 RepID=UPI001412A9B1|nr:FAD-dependent oxidoreductase [Runella sp. CRIBMP]NBB21879.1 FAD-dependent oxidoreductase [Runella sp. CRIBMP]